MNRPTLIFDMDGVLVDVTGSYRETIARTVEHFAGVQLTGAEIQEAKNRGGLNNDWELTHHLIAAAGAAVPFEDVKACFQRLFLGNGSDGLIRGERWVARPGVLERLGERFHMAVFTGRPQQEARLTLDRFADGLVFDPVIALEDVANPKPAPDGLLRILECTAGSEAYYIGDSVDDAAAAKAAHVPFIGIAAPSNPLYLDLVFLFQAQGAYAIVDDINFLEEVFSA